MQRGKSICKQLKAVRHRIAEENNIPLEQRECTYDGPCRGTCPRCEAEVRYLEKSLAQRLHLGKAATVAGLSLSLAACGGQQPDGQSPLVKTDSLNSPSDTLETTLPPDDSTADKTEKNNIIEDEGLIIMDGICIENDTLPPPPPPYDETLIEGEVEDCDEELEGEVRIFKVVETDPEFPGGIDSMYAWIERNLRYPTLARNNKIEGKVYVTFVVGKDGSISNAKILCDIGGGCGAEVIRIVNQMPRWIPGKQRGKPVCVQFNLPVNFQLK